MDISNAIARYLNDVVFSEWSITGCLKFLAEKDIWVTSQKREEIMNEFKRQTEMTSTHQSLIQKARNKAAKLSSSAEWVFQFAEVTAFFDRMDKEANERLLNVKTSLYESAVKVQVMGDKLVTLCPEPSTTDDQKRHEFVQEDQNGEKTIETLIRKKHPSSGGCYEAKLIP
ncbi:7_t:CDS:2 [Paraglomus occultum]|uniref:7_t:CDS:1 n=1 Tax=Paraglomus occultum TaxID=144539 RepID=A0A9N9GFA7_9GLOM|nr:7_t:CDS:2 [Paraglomus occultum]